MGNAGTVSVSLTAEHSQFDAGMKSASKSVSDFGKHAEDSKHHMEEFNAEMLTSRHAIQTFAGLGDVGAAPIMHMVHAFEVLPGPAGLVLGAIFAVKEAFSAYGESIEKAAEEHKKLIEAQENFEDGLRSIKELLEDEALDKFDKAYNKLGEDIEKLNRKMRDAQSKVAPGQGSEAQTQIHEQIKELEFLQEGLEIKQAKVEQEKEEKKILEEKNKIRKAHNKEDKENQKEFDRLLKEDERYAKQAAKDQEHLDRLLEEFDMEDKIAGVKERVEALKKDKTGTASAVDTAHINVMALTMQHKTTEVHSPQLTEANAQLKALNEQMLEIRRNNQLNPISGITE